MDTATGTRRRPPVSGRDRRARIGAAGAYFVQGLCFAALLTQVPALKERFGFSDGQLAIILLAVPVVAGVGSLLAGTLAAPLGSAVVLRVAGPTVCLGVAAVGVALTRPLLYLAVALFGLAVGAVDATMNMQGVAVQRRYRRSLLASFHGWWSLAGIAGSLWTAASVRLGLSLDVALSIAAVTGLVLALAAGPSLLRHDEDAVSTAVADPAGAAPAPAPVASNATSGPAPIRWDLVVLIGLAVMAMYIAESATSNWSAVYLHDALLASRSVAALGLAAYLTCQLAGRAVADRVVQRFGPVATVAAGGAVGAAGMALVAASPVPAIGIAGFAIVGLGLCVVVPQAFSAAGELDTTGTGIAIARVNLFNYLGFVVGAALIGAVAEWVGLRFAFVVPTVLSLGIVALAPAFRPIGTTGGAAGGAAGRAPGVAAPPEGGPAG